MLSRALLRDPDQGAAVRQRLSARYSHLLLDEFQDTDPIQIELAVRIAAAEPLSDQAGDAPWNEVPVAPGHLFVVGDPKQSIYRFRRADISVFMAAAKRLGLEGGGVVELSANFRTVRPIIDWVNTTFGMLMAEPPDVELDAPSQPTYVALGANTRNHRQSVRPSHCWGERTSRRLLRPSSALQRRAMLRRPSAERSAKAGASAMAPARWRPAELGDITVLVPARAPHCPSSRTRWKRPTSHTEPNRARSCTRPGPSVTF